MNSVFESESKLMSAKEVERHDLLDRELANRSRDPRIRGDAGRIATLVHADTLRRSDHKLRTAKLSGPPPPPPRQSELELECQGIIALAEAGADVEYAHNDERETRVSYHPRPAIGAMSADAASQTGKRDVQLHCSTAAQTSAELRLKNSPAPEPSSLAWAGPIATDWQKQHLRFRVGDEVECNVAGWMGGVVAGLFHQQSPKYDGRISLVDAGVGTFRTEASYHVRLYNGSTITVRSDDTSTIRPATRALPGSPHGSASSPPPRPAASPSSGGRGPVLTELKFAGLRDVGKLQAEVDAMLHAMR